jgi:hypothetical protein
MSVVDERNSRTVFVRGLAPGVTDEVKGDFVATI